MPFGRLQDLDGPFGHLLCLLTRPAQAHKPLPLLKELPAVVAAINAVILHYQVPPGTGGTVVARPPGRCWEITVRMRGISQLLLGGNCVGLLHNIRRSIAKRGGRGV